MSIRLNLYIILIITAIAPFIVTLLFYFQLNEWYKHEQSDSKIEAMVRVNELSAFMGSHSDLVHRVGTLKKAVSDELNQNESVTVYSDNFNPLFTTKDHAISSENRNPNQVMRGLFELKTTIRGHTYKEPIFNEDRSILAYFVVEIERTAVEEKTQETYWLAIIIFIFALVGTITLVHFWLKRRMIFPINYLLAEMRGIGQGTLHEDAQLLKKQKGEMGQLIAGFRDMNSRLIEAKENEEEEIANQQRLIAAISHDLRTPLTSIRAYAEGMGIHLDKQEDYAQVILSKTAFMQKLIDDLLAYSAIQASSFTLDRTEVEAEELAELLVDGYEEQEMGVEFSSTIAVEPAMVNCDVNRLIQVIDNLVMNAVRYSDERGEVSILITNKGSFLPTFVSYSPDRLYFIVTDRGRGIPKEEQERIFSSFYQIEHARKQNKSSGVGLGLSICQELVEKHNGTMHVYSKGIGSTFYFSIPTLNDGNREDEEL
ncbi:sensor histidine kinase [Alkalicoccobacillus plakortidis]|uniref:histidine kinase n=1 Tax=Alkalicoccobacillus plakortidis TaxID=444060 RepID=A0ABT0XG31_9BACI|nr:HAMP domain-containing sensor histidine kinase [Alkalicoccobacillus plakortidis]MCM2674308.1 HAMP domain-containing histidine kinase [Alkalicoccobacillus plakortidis]